MNEVSWAQENQILNGKPGNIFDPKNNLTSAVAAVVLMNYQSAFQNQEEQALPSEPEEQNTQTAPNDVTAQTANENSNILIAISLVLVKTIM